MYLFPIIALPRHLSQRLLVLHPQFLLGKLTPLRRIRVSPLPSPHSESASRSSGSHYISILGSPPVTFTMSALGPNTSHGPGPNAGNTTSGIATGTITAAPFLPYMAGLNLPDFN